MKSRFYIYTLFLVYLVTLPCFATIWVQPLYYADQEQLDGDLQAYSSKSGAILFGGDKKISDTVKLGIGGSYFNVVQSYCNYPNQHIDVQNYQGFLYGAFYFPQNMEVDWLANVGVNNYKQSYILNNTTNTTASYTGQQYMARVIGLKNYKKQSMTFAPQLNANILYLHNNPYNQAGSNAQISQTNAGVMMLGAGFKASADYSRGKVKTKPEIRCLIFYDVFTADINALTAFLIGGPALQTSATPYRPSGQFGASITLMVSDNFNCSLNYDLLVKNIYFNNVVSLKFNYLI